MSRIGDERSMPGYYQFTRDGAPLPAYLSIGSSHPLAVKVTDGPVTLTSCLVDPGSDNAGSVSLHDCESAQDVSDANRICRVTANGAPAGFANIPTPVARRLWAVRDDATAVVSVWWLPG